MNEVHFHLLINHLPVIGSFLASLVLAHGIWVKSNQIKIVGFYLLFLSAIGVIVAYITGEGSEDAVEQIAGVSKATLERHGEFAMYAMIVLILAGIASVLGLVLAIRKSPLVNAVSIITLVITLAGFGLAARTANLGGKIRHTELDSATGSNAPAAENLDKD